MILFRMIYLRWCLTFIALVGSLIWYADKRRGADFEPFVLSQCEADSCKDFGPEIAASFRETERTGFNLWPKIDHCAIASQIVGEATSGSQARFVPNALIAMRVINVEALGSSFKIAPGSAILGPLAPLRELFTHGGAPSCHMSNYDPWLYLSYLVTLLVWCVPGIKRKRDEDVP